MNKVRRNWGTQVLMLLVVLTGLYFGYSFAREVVQAQRLAAQAEASRQQNDDLAAQNRKLARDLQYYQSDAYAELRARTDLNMRRKDETIVLPVLPADAQADTTAVTAQAPAIAPPAPASVAPPAAQAAASGQPSGRTWDQWFALFATR
jgi:cell division protein FtsB